MDELLKQLVVMGPGGIVAGMALFAWYQERSERRETQVQLNELGKRSIEADFAVAKSLDGITGAMNLMIARRP